MSEHPDAGSNTNHSQEAATLSIRDAFASPVPHSSTTSPSKSASGASSTATAPKKLTDLEFVKAFLFSYMDNASFCAAVIKEASNPQRTTPHVTVMLPDEALYPHQPFSTLPGISKLLTEEQAAKEAFTRVALILKEHARFKVVILQKDHAFYGCRIGLKLHTAYSWIRDNGNGASIVFNILLAPLNLLNGPKFTGRIELTVQPLSRPVLFIERAKSRMLTIGFCLTSAAALVGGLAAAWLWKSSAH